MIRQNCWENLKCGRGPGGDKISEFGQCPASIDKSCNELNGGTNGGRICWAIAGTFCGGKVQGTHAEKEMTCMSCAFFKKVKEEEGLANFKLMKPGQVYTPHQK